MFKPRVFKNVLTDKIEKDTNFTLVDILLHKDFSSTIRAESDILYRRLLSNNAEGFKEILKYALFDNEAPEQYANYNRVRQINHNASNFLESCGKKFASFFTKESNDNNLIRLPELKKLLNDNVEEFISPNTQINQDRMYAGHFQRFFENFFRWKAFGTTSSDISEILSKIIPFLIKNCKILAYQQLLSRFLCDYNGSVDEETKYLIISQILYFAYQAVKYIRTQPENPLHNVEKKDSYILKESEQPINLKKIVMPLSSFQFNCINRILSNEPDNLEIDWNEKYKIETQFDNVEDAEFLSYLLIMSIRTSVFEQCDIVNIFRDDEENNYILIQALLYCGIRSDVKSLISLESFRLLEIIFDGIPNMDIDKWKSHESEKLNLNFYKKYADSLVYDAEKPNLKMIQALPIFWNHRYNIDTYKMSEDESKPVDISDYYDNTSTKTRKREEGETAFEILQPCLLAEPPISSNLICTGTKIFINILKERKELRENEDHSEEILDLMVYLDGIVIDFYKHHFKFASWNETKMCDLFQNIIPLPPIDQYFAKDAEQLSRAPLNGFLIDLFLRMYDTTDNNNCLFDVNDDLIMTSMSHCKEVKEFDAYIYLVLRVKDVIKLNALRQEDIFNFSSRDNYNDNIEEEDQKKADIDFNNDDDEINENQVKK